MIGGNTWTAGDVVPLNFIRAMRLPGGRRPRMDLYGHNPFGLRKPDLRRDPIAFGTADFRISTALARWLDRYGYRDAGGRRLRLFLSELSFPPTTRTTSSTSGSAGRSGPVAVRRLRITRRWRRIYTLGYLGLYDDPPRAGRPRGQPRPANPHGREKACFATPFSEGELTLLYPVDTDGAEV